MNLWTRKLAIQFISHLEMILSPDYHVSLAGGVLFKGSSDHDLDVILFPHNTNRYILAEIHSYLMTMGEMSLIVPVEKMHKHWRSRGSTDTKHVEAWNWQDRRVDIIYFPGMS